MIFLNWKKTFFFSLLLFLPVVGAHHFSSFYQTYYHTLPAETFTVSPSIQNPFMLPPPSTSMSSMTKLSNTSYRSSPSNSFAPSPTFSPAIKTIRLTISHANGFFPSTITVNQGDRVRILAITESGTADHGHGITIPAFGVNQIITSESQPQTIEFVASQPGTFSIFCGTCSQGTHFRLGGRSFSGTLIVNPRQTIQSKAMQQSVSMPFTMTSTSIPDQPVPRTTNSFSSSRSYYRPY